MSGAGYYGGVLAPNGKIYGIPRTATSILEINLGVTTPFTPDVLDSAYFDKL